MAAKNFKMDVSNTLSLIRSFWPDFPISKEDFLKPTPEFVFRFYSNFVAEVNEKFAFLTNEELVEKPDTKPEFGKECDLYLQVMQIYSHLDYSAFNVFDLYDPVPKRTHALLKFSIHFLIYLNNSLDEMSNVINGSYKKFTDVKNLQTLKQQCLQDCAENSENIARGKETNEILKTKLATATKRHEKMLKDKDKIYAKKTAELSKLRTENYNLDYQLNYLSEKESSLEQRLVTEEEFENLKTAKQFLEQELKQLSNGKCGLDDDVIKKFEMAKRLEEHAKNLETLQLASIDVELLGQSREEAKTQENVEKELKRKEEALGVIAMKKEDTVNKKKLKLKEKKKQYSELVAKISKEKEHEETRYKNKIAQYTAKFEEAKRLETKTACVQEEIKQIDHEEQILKEAGEKHYQKIINADKNTMTKFTDMLLALKNRK